MKAAWLMVICDRVLARASLATFSTQGSHKFPLRGNTVLVCRPEYLDREHFKLSRCGFCAAAPPAIGGSA